MLSEFALRYILLACIGITGLYGCINPLGLVGRKRPGRDCEPILSLLKGYSDSSVPVPTVVSQFIYESSLTDEDKENHIVCCPDNFTLTESILRAPGAIILKNMEERCGDSISKRISYGTASTFMAFPWSALLMYDTPRRFHCGGNLITERYVITAAHCVIESYFPLIGVRLREHNISSEVDCVLDDGGLEHCSPPVLDLGIESATIHPGYSRNRHNNDIALIRLSRYIRFGRTIRPVCLPLNRSEEHEENKGVIVGWGATEHSHMSEVLMMAEVPLFNLTDCQRMYRRYTIDNNKICAAGENGVGVCTGDSGGPLFLRVEGYYMDRKFRYVQVGIISLGVGTCGDKRNFPALFTRVSFYKEWIENVLEI